MNALLRYLRLLVCLHAVMGQFAFAGQAPDTVFPSLSAAEINDYQDALQDRRASLLRFGDPKYIDLKVSYVRAHDILAATALKGCGEPDWPLIMINLAGIPSDGNPLDEPVENFSLPPLVRYLYQFGNCLTDVQKKELLSKFNRRLNLTGHGTTNQAVIRASSWYLLAQYFPAAIWNDIETNKSYTSAKLMALLKLRLAERTKGFFHYGQAEWLSPSYAITNEYPLLNLIDFAVDEEVKKNASDEAILEISMLRVQSFHGVIVPPLTRKNFDQRNALDKPQSYVPSNSQQELWYYFGEPAHFGLYDFRSGLGAYIVSMLAISRWLPPDPVLYLNYSPASGNGASAIGESKSVKTVTPGFAMWGEQPEPEIYGDSIITDDFSIGTGNMNFDPYGYSVHIQTFSILLKSDRAHNEIECYQPYWNSAMGEDAWTTDRSSPFQQMIRYDDTSVLMLFDIPKTDPWKENQNNRFWALRSKNMDALLQLVTCRFGRDFDEIVEEKNWVFVRQGNVFVAMATLNGVNEYDNAGGGLLTHFKVVKIREPKTALFFRVEKQTPSLNFEQFRNNARNNLPNYDKKNSSASFTEKDGTKTQIAFEIHKPLKGKLWSALPRVIKDGKVVNYDRQAVVQSTGMTLRDGVLTIRSAGGELVISH